MNTNKCPTHQQLNQFVGGFLALDDHEKIEFHVDCCDDCQDTVVVLDEGGHTIVNQLISAIDPAESVSHPQLDSLVEQGKAVWREMSSSVKRGGDRETFAEQFPAGTEMGNYVLQETLGAGSMGCVVKAYHQRMKRDVALKFISPELTNSPDVRMRFQREIEAAARLQHPNLIAAHDAGEFDGQHFLAMEYVRGRDLRQIVKRAGRLEMRQAVGYILQAARGLEHAHSVGVVHRDVKPGNLMLDEHKVVKVLDLGLARLLVNEPVGDPSEDESRSQEETDNCVVDLTQTGYILGTTAFMSPEQCAGSNEIDHRTDIYSLGCTLYYLLTSTNVFQEKTAIAMLRAHAEKDPPSLSESRLDCSQTLELLFQAMLAKRPDDRPQTMSSVIEQLEFIQKSAEDETEIRSTSKHAAQLSAVGQREQSSQADNQSRNSRRLLVGVGGAALLLTGLYYTGVFSGVAPSGATVGVEGGAKVGVNVGEDVGVEVHMVKIPSGEFLMGSPADESGAGSMEKPEHLVKISKPFLLGKFEVTVGQFNAVMNETRPAADSSSAKPADLLPVSGLSWLDAIKFCNRLSERNGCKPFYRVEGGKVSVHRGSNGYRLPTEAEWEYACRANSKSKWHFGDDAAQLVDFAWISGNSKGVIQPVGKKKPNAFGLFDMHGNVPEWCWDRFDPAYYSKSEAIDPPGSSSGDLRVFRGGGVTNSPLQTRSASRIPLGMRYGVLNDVGLRVARSID
jgi:serine/threonine protein kinase